MTEYLGVEGELAFEELVRRLSHKGYDLQHYEIDNLKEIESLIDTNSITSNNVSDFLEYLEGVQKRFNHIIIEEQREGIDITNLKEAMFQVHFLKEKLLKVMPVDSIEYDDKRNPFFFVNMTSFNCTK